MRGRVKAADVGVAALVVDGWPAGQSDDRKMVSASHRRRNLCPTEQRRFVIARFDGAKSVPSESVNGTHFQSLRLVRYRSSRTRVRLCPVLARASNMRLPARLTKVLSTALAGCSLSPVWLVLRPLSRERASSVDHTVSAPLIYVRPLTGSDDCRKSLSGLSGPD